MHLCRLIRVNLYLTVDNGGNVVTAAAAAAALTLILCVWMTTGNVRKSSVSVGPQAAGFVTFRVPERNQEIDGLQIVRACLGYL
jgi:hypothetical protein